MQCSSISYIKKELNTIPKNELLEICHQLISYKKENKELVHYLLFEQTHEQTYVSNLKNEIDELFATVNTQSVFFAKKTIRKIVRFITKYANFSSNKTTTIDLLIHFCNQMNELKLDWKSSKLMCNIYKSQLQKIAKNVALLHEDLQFDYQQQICELRL